MDHNFSDKGEIQSYPKHVLLDEQEEAHTLEMVHRNQDEHDEQRNNSKQNSLEADEEENIGNGKQESTRKTGESDSGVVKIIRNYGISYDRHFGNYCVFRFRNHEPTITIGPHWPLFSLSYCALMFAGYKLLEITFEEFSIGFQLLSTAFVVALLGSYMATALINPGIASAQYEIVNPQEVDHIQRYCKPCQILRPKGTTHCYDCDVCIKDYDHHCPWTGKCIGGGNITMFYAFIISMLSFMIYSFMLIFSTTK